MKQIQIPTQIIDRANCCANIAWMQEKARRSGAVLRPHFKTHQSVEVGRWFRDEGVDRIAVSSVSMARQFADDGWKDIMIAFPLNIREMEAINQLAAEVNLGLLVSSPGVTSLLKKQLKHPAGIYFKVDVGTHRTGFDPEDISTLEIELDPFRGDSLMQFRGFVSHAGHTYQAVSKGQILRIYQEGTAILKSLKERFLPAFPGLHISWGDTPTCALVEAFDGLDEIRPGNFVFFDLMQWQLGACTFDQIGMVVAAPVVALHPARREVVVYAGAVHLSKEQLTLAEGNKCFGMMVSLDEKGKWQLPGQMIYVDRVSQEHGILKLPQTFQDDIRIGQLLGIIPVHSCLAADLLPQRLIV